LTIDGTEPVTLEGSVTAIDPTVDPVTRSLRVRATAPDKGDKLRPGMFVRVAVVLPTKRSVVTVPVTAIVHASYGNSVFVLEDKPAPDGKPTKMARQQFVRTGETRGDFAAVEDGLKGGEEVIIAGAFKVRNGGRVIVNNDVKPNPQLEPRPMNR
jgi:membrane fusion protein (multidrug efflux system)